MKNPLIEKSWQPWQSRFVGWLASILGSLVFAGSVIPAFIAQYEGPNDYLFVLLSLGMFAGGAAIFIYGKRHLTRSAASNA